MKNKKILYESIMKDVSKSIKKKLNEDMENEFYIDINAQSYEDGTVIDIYGETLPENIMAQKNSFLRFLRKYFPLLKWEFDDGEDTPFTEYVQYVAYPSKNSKDYILAAWNSKRYLQS